MPDGPALALWRADADSSRVLREAHVDVPLEEVKTPYLPFIGVFGFVPLPDMLLITVTVITAL